MSEDSCWGYFECLARCCLEVAIVADGLENWIWIMVSCGFFGFVDIILVQEGLQGIRTVCHVHLGGCQVVTELAGIDNVICERRSVTPRIQIRCIWVFNVGFDC